MVYAAGSSSHWAMTPGDGDLLEAEPRIRRDERVDVLGRGRLLRAFASITPRNETSPCRYSRSAAPDVLLPERDVALAAADLVRAVTPEPLYNPLLRSYYFGPLNPETLRAPHRPGE